MLILIVMAIGCSVKQNTSQSRLWHAFTANYNTYYNGSVAYIDGSLEKENGNHDNFTELIPLYTVGNKASIDLGSANFEIAITKAKKAIHQHSIKRRPTWTPGRRKTQEDIEWLSRREYNPFLWKAWLLMGKSQFHKGAFEDAASTFAYMSRLYSTQPAIYGKARAWLAKCYIEQGWMYDAEEVIRNMQRDSLDWRAIKEWDYTYADYYIRTGNYEKAIPYLQKVIRHELRRKQRAREWYLMGQLEAALGRKELANRAFRRVIRQHPPYELAFNARIAMTEVSASGQGKKQLHRLERMASSDNNKDFLDQIYYAEGNIFLARRDTARAIAAYEKGNQKSVRNGTEKGVLLLKLGNLYWKKQRFSDARRCYGEAIGLLDKDRSDYEQLSERSAVLDELVPHIETVHLQDSLQTLARMDEKARNAAIDRVIIALKRQEKMQRNALDSTRTIQSSNERPLIALQKTVNRTAFNGQSQGDLWYFYNPLIINEGKTAFQRLWGRRENVDNWQRINKTVVAGLNTEDRRSKWDRDSLVSEDPLLAPPQASKDSVQNDPHRREYYLAQIPFTSEQLAASNRLLVDGLFHAGVIFKDKLDNLTLSERELTRIVAEYRTFEHLDEVYYHLFLLYSRRNQPTQAGLFLQKLKAEYPKSQWTSILSDPYFRENARVGVHLEDSLYTATYAAFKAGRYAEAMGNVHLSAQKFPKGANRDKFIFINGLSKLNEGDAQACLNSMTEVVTRYPESSLSEMAGMLIKGVNAGRRLHTGQFDIGDVWAMRSRVGADSDSIAVHTFSNDRNADFLFVIAYRPDSVDEHRLLFQLAGFNFTSFLVRNFDIGIEDVEGVHRMLVSGFRNYDEALQYARRLYGQRGIARLMKEARKFIISRSNLELIGRGYSYDDYDRFYAKHFASLKVSMLPLLIEPEEVATKPDSMAPTVPKSNETGLYFNNVLDTTVKPKTVDKKTNKKQPIVKKTEKKEKKAFDPEDEYYELEGF